MNEQKLTAIIVADALGKATTSALVEHVLAAPDPWNALALALDWQEELSQARQARPELSQAEQDEIIRKLQGGGI